MFRTKHYFINVVYNDELIWLENRKEQMGRCFFRLPLEDVLNSDGLAGRIPKSLKGNYHSLLIVPDHWFGTEHFPFQSRKAGLIEAFLERKLGAKFPELKKLNQFISYRHAPVANTESGIYAYFLQDPKSFKLYQALQRLNMSPRHITAPGFLWMETLSNLSSEFDRSGTLLVHMSNQEGLLYFYFKGQYLFSRDVRLAETDDRLSALVFEINQSLYMFSQKTKSELTQLYLLNGSAEDLEGFSDALGREVTNLDALLDQSSVVKNTELPLLDGLLQSAHFTKTPSFLSVSHREVRRELLWEPVQWVGIFIGALLLAALLGENVLLSNIRKEQDMDIQNLHRKQPAMAEISLAETNIKLDQILQNAEGIKPHDVIYHLLISLPEEIRIKEIELILEGQTELALTAQVFARNMDHLQTILARLEANIREQFSAAQAFSLKNVDIGSENVIENQPITHYLISFRLNLS